MPRSVCCCIAPLWEFSRRLSRKGFAAKGTGALVYEAAPIDSFSSSLSYFNWNVSSRLLAELRLFW